MQKLRFVPMFFALTSLESNAYLKGILGNDGCASASRLFLIGFTGMEAQDL